MTTPKKNNNARKFIGSAMLAGAASMSLSPLAAADTAEGTEKENETSTSVPGTSLNPSKNKIADAVRDHAEKVEDKLNDAKDAADEKAAERDKATQNAARKFIQDLHANELTRPLAIELDNARTELSRAGFYDKVAEVKQELRDREIDITPAPELEAALNESRVNLADRVEQNDEDITVAARKFIGELYANEKTRPLAIKLSEARVELNRAGFYEKIEEVKRELRSPLYADIDITPFNGE